MYKKIKSFVSFSAIVALVVMGFSFIDEADAGVSDNVSGYAWSDNIGWISFNNTSDGSGVDYGVSVDYGGTGYFSGYAWSDNIGWIDFAPTSGYPEAPNHGVRLESDNTVTGWARAVAGADFSDGWDGWIKMSGSWSNGVRLVGNNFEGYAWGDEVVGWIDFNPGISGAGVSVGVSLPQCSDGVDNDGDTVFDHSSVNPINPDPGCSSPADTNEDDNAPQCSDGVDNADTEDSLIDMADPGCTNTSDNNEDDNALQCSDGVDNDGDTVFDHSSVNPINPDPGCSSVNDDDETNIISSFSLSKTGDIEVDLVQGAGNTTSSATTITVIPSGGFSNTVTLTVTNPDVISGATYNIPNPSIDNSEYDNGIGSTFSVVVPSDTSPGTYVITIKGTDGSLDRFISVSLEVSGLNPGYGEF